jgi:hypothetical protein
MFASVQAFERGIEVVRPHDDAGIANAATGQNQGVDSQPPPPLAPVAKRPGKSGDKRRAQLYVGIGIAVVGLLLLLFVTPSATIILTVAATPLTDTEPIQGSTAAPTAGETNYVQTQVVTSQKSDSFQANPTGSQQLPASAAAGEVFFATDLTSPTISIPSGDIFQTADSPPIQFVTQQATTVGPLPSGGGPGSGQFGAWSTQAVHVVDQNPEAKGNVAANKITVLPEDPCTAPAGQPPIPPSQCSPSDFKITNLSPTSGGADARTVGTAQSSDLQGWNSQVNTLEQQLTSQVQSDMKSKADGRVFAVTTNDGSQNTGLPAVSCALNPQLPAEGAQFSATTVTVTCQASGVTYSMSDVRNTVFQELSTSKPENEQLATNSCNIPTPQTSQVSADGTIALNFSGSGVTCFSTPPIQGAQLKSQLACKSPDDAKQLLQDANNGRLQNVEIDQHPFGLFFLPCLSARISVSVSFLQTQPPSAVTPTP